MKKSIVALLSTTVILTGCNTVTQNTKSNVKYTSWFDTSDIRSQSTAHTLNRTRGYSYKIDNTIVRRGSESERMELRDGDCSSNGDWSDCKHGNARYEREESNDRQITYGNVHWLGYSIYVPKEGWERIFPGKIYAGQVKPIGGRSHVQSSLGARPAVALELAQDVSVRLPQTWNNCSTGLTINYFLDKWTDVVIMMDTSYEDSNGDGVFLEVYIDDKLVCKQTHSFLVKQFHSHSKQLGFRYGIYDIAHKEQRDYWKYVNKTNPSIEPKVPTKVIYYDEMRLGKERIDVDVRMREQAGYPPTN